jgi:hypothetical protein
MSATASRAAIIQASLLVAAPAVMARVAVAPMTGGTDALGETVDVLESIDLEIVSSSSAAVRDPAGHRTNHLDHSGNRGETNEPASTVVFA